MRDDKKNIIDEKSFEFSLRIVKFCKALRNHGHYDLARQVFRSGTSIGANVREAQNAESRKDFIHKFKIATKEADEVEYWLLLCKESSEIPSPGELCTDALELMKIMSKIISTTKTIESKA